MKLYTREQALEGSKAPDDVLGQMALVRVPYRNFEGHDQIGTIVVHESVTLELRSIFLKLYIWEFPIASIVPIVDFDWDDDASMAAGNTSGFNYRFVAGTDRLSNHSFGRAVDVNPHLNPYDSHSGEVLPRGATYDPSRPGTLSRDGSYQTGAHVIELFESYGWSWGGDWATHTDRHHFQKAQ